jgi:hypothetical protein
MATLNIQGRNVQVDDSFLKLTPADQQATVDEIASSFTTAEPTTANNLVRSAGSGIPVLGGLLNKADAATNAALAPILNPLFDTKDQLAEPTWGERYAHSLRDQEGADQKFSEQHPYVDTTAKLAGGVASMVPAVAAAPGLFGATGSLSTRVLNGGISNALLGGADSAARGQGPIGGALLGGAIGAAAPIAGAVASPFISGILGRISPEKYATRQVARAIGESGQTPAALGQRVADANAAGQPQFTLADALGNPGQRLLSGVARAPGQGRTDVVNALEARQAGQGERVGDIIDQGLGAGNTARQTIDQLTESARRESAPLYRDALNRQPVWNDRMQQFFDHPATTQGLREGVGVQHLESLASGQPFNPHDYAITNFNAAGDPIISAVPNMRTINLIKKGWDNILEGYRDKTTGRLVLDERGRALDQVRRSFLNEVDSLNPTYGQARAAYAGPAQVRDAVGVGAEAASRGRATDNLQRFDALNPQSQQGFRAGYADTLATRIEGATFGRNKVQPLSSEKATNELDALSLHQGPVQPGALNPLQQRLAREQTMFDTRHQALGGSKTADNLADNAALAVNPTLIGHVISGHWTAAIGSMLHAGSNAATGNTAATRKAVADILLRNGANLTPAALDTMVAKTIAQIQFLQNLARSGAGATTVTTNQATKKSKPSIFVSRNQ